MSFLTHLFASITLFVGSLFGSVHSVPSAIPTPDATTTSTVMTMASRPSVILDGKGNVTNYTKDDQHVYFFGNLFGKVGSAGSLPLSGVDLSTFSVITDFDTRQWGTHSYSKDKNRVYYAACGDDGCGVSVIVGADPRTFTVVHSIPTEMNGYAKDGRNVYFDANVVAGADPDTFTFLGATTYNSGDYFKDKGHVYWFSALNDNAAPLLEGVDASSFVLASSSLETKDPSLVLAQTISCGQGCLFDAQDKNHKYLNGRIAK
jgi:hypothetical protein